MNWTVRLKQVIVTEVEVQAESEAQAVGLALITEDCTIVDIIDVEPLWAKQNP